MKTIKLKFSASSGKTTSAHPDAPIGIDGDISVYSIDTCTERPDGRRECFCTAFEKLPGKRWAYLGMK